MSANTTTAAELFLYNPRLLFTMPDSMRDVPITWPTFVRQLADYGRVKEEVAP